MSIYNSDDIKTVAIATLGNNLEQYRRGLDYLFKLETSLERPDNYNRVPGPIISSRVGGGR